MLKCCLLLLSALQLEGSLMTEYSSLLSLGFATIDRYSGETVPEEIQGKYKLAPNKMWPTGRLVRRYDISAVVCCAQCVVYKHSNKDGVCGAAVSAACDEGP